MMHVLKIVVIENICNITVLNLLFDWLRFRNFKFCGFAVEISIYQNLVFEKVLFYSVLNSVITNLAY